LVVIGKGGFGKVWKIQSKQNNKYFALKEISKMKIINKNSIKSVMNERNILTLLKSEYIVNILCAFQNQKYLYLVMDFMPGGDLRYHLSIHRRLS
jgi:serine/threonine protein kinase